MSIEVEAHDYIYADTGAGAVPDPESESEMDVCAKRLKFERELTDAATNPSPLQEPPAHGFKNSVPFRYSPLHDFESVVWLSFYLLLAVELKNIGDLTPYQMTAQHILTYRLFCDLAFRKNVIWSGVLTNNLTEIHPDRKSTRLNSSHSGESRMPSSA